MAESRRAPRRCVIAVCRDFEASARGYALGLAPLQDTVGESYSGASFSAQPESGSASVSDLTLKAGQISGKGNASTDGKKLDAALSLALSSLKGIAPSLSGPLELKLRASGPLLSPGGELTLASPHLGVETATLEGLRVRLNTPSVGAAGGKGTLDVSATLSDASIKVLQVARRCAFPRNGSSRLTVSACTRPSSTPPA
ncbi:MAG: hypothetical protein ACLU4B_02620 [Bilophila wadsworthia]